MRQNFVRDQTFSCVGKDRLTSGVAHQIAKRQSGTAYRCNHCGGWHVGHRPAHKVSVAHRRPKFYPNDEEMA